MINSLLVANRGEIALRIVRTCRDLGIRSIAVYSDHDECAPHTVSADEAIRIGASPAAESYLSIDSVLEAARQSRAEAIHPGYGFLSESAEFASAVRDSGFVFVGPSTETMRALADKRSARSAAIAAELPVLTGMDIVDLDEVDDATVINHVGLPLLVKAAFGGGGRGMRIVRDAQSLRTALTEAARESRAAFGRDEVYVETFIEHARHVEVQVVGDRHGGVVHLGTRDCTTQRRHQKLLEEAPASALDTAIRDELTDGAVRLASALRYEGVGTVEYLYDRARRQWYFIEVNARLQVEHTVTEMVTGIDLVATQLAIAAGEPHGLEQGRLVVNGHATQARINAEDPTNGFLPSIGPLGPMAWPSGPWVRCDVGVDAGTTVSPHYDSLLAKVATWGPTREDARVRLARALDEVAIDGVPTTAPFLRQLIEHPTFTLDEQWTGMIDGGDLDISLPTRSVRLDPSDEWSAMIATVDGMLQVRIPLAGVRSAEVDRRQFAQHDEHGGASLVSQPPASAPMDGVVVSILVEVGDAVLEGQTVALIESMKMETPIVASMSGTVTAVYVGAGDAVQRGATVLDIAEPEGST